MRPDDNKPIPSGQPRGVVTPPQRSHLQAHSAVADLTRSQIDSIYDQQALGAQQPTQATQPNVEPGSAAQTDNAYRRSHTAAHTIQPEAWRNYHSAWQQYYQKYYEHYYVGAVNQVHKAYMEHATALQSQKPTEGNNQPQSTAGDSSSISRDEAMYDLRGQLLEKVQDSGRKVRRSRHFVPIMATILVLVGFAFLQFNSLIIGNVKAYITPGEIDPQNIVVDPNASIQVSDEPRLIIPKINVNVPVIYDVTPDQNSQLKAMENGVAWFGIPGANSKPGQIGNTVISGHSSNDFTESGNYKFVFALLERLKEGDTFYLHYKGTRYTYSVTNTKVVKPTNVGSLVYDTTKPEVTLITCTPLGTALNRLLVTAEQVSPAPETANSAPSGSGGSSDAVMPGNAPTVFERVFGGR